MGTLGGNQESGAILMALLPFQEIRVLFCYSRDFILIKFHLLIFIFIYITLGGRLKKILLQFMLRSVLPMLSSKNFIDSGVTFRSLIHFKLIFVYDGKECSNFLFFFFLHEDVKFSQQEHLSSRLSFPHCLVLPPLP